VSEVNTVKYLKDYRQPDFWVTHVDLTFDIRDGETLVSAKLQVKKNGSHQHPLVLDGEEIVLDGYIYPLESKDASQHFVLSSNPLSACYFCGNAGPESVVEVHSKFLIPHSRLPIKLRGIFRINSGDPTGMIYELLEAEEIR